MNISSLEIHFQELLALPDILKHFFDILGISETRRGALSSGYIDLPGYSFVHTPSTSNAGGTGFYISEKLTYFPRDDLTNFLHSDGLLESVFCELKLVNRKNLLIGCVYRHPSMDIL